MNASALEGLVSCAVCGARDFALSHRSRVAEAARDWLSALAAGISDPAGDRFQRAGMSGDGALAFQLGSLSHLAEVNDGIGHAMIHPGVVTFPVLMEVALAQPLTVERFLTATAAGYEAAARIGAALGRDHYRRFHMTGTAGSFAAALTAGVGMGLSPRALADAVALGGAQAAGLWQAVDDGADAVKPAHAGFAGRNGIYAARLASAGIVGPHRILEGARGLAAAGGSVLDCAPLDARFAPSSSGLLSRTVKSWPVCGQMFHVLDALVPMRPAPDVDAITITSFAALREVAGQTMPDTPAAARFSTAFCVAHLLVHGRLDFGDLDAPGVLQDQAVRALALRVELRDDAAMTAAHPQLRRARITMRQADGTVRTIDADGRRGEPDRRFHRANCVGVIKD